MGKVAAAFLALAASQALGAEAADDKAVPGLEPPTIRFFYAADYPDAALAANKEADLPCSIELDEHGDVLFADCDAADDSSKLVLAREATRALERCHFFPARLRGQPVAARIESIYRFATAAEPLSDIQPVHGSIDFEGDVVTQGIRAPVAGADVIAEGLGQVASTDALGHFKMALPPGSHVLLVTLAGDLPAQQRVEVAPGAQTGAVIFLRPRVVTALSATVVGTKDQRAGTRDTVSHEELRNVPGTQGDPIRVIQLLPGLARAPFTSGQLIVRGANAEDTGAYLDGIRIPQLYHLQNGPSVLSEEFVERIDFSAGGAGALYGRSLAGTVAVLSHKGDPERWHGSLAVDLQKSVGFLQGPIGPDTQVSFGARHSYLNPLLPEFADQNKSFTVPIYWDYQARVDRRLGPHDQLILTALGSNDTFEQVGNGRGEVPAALQEQIGFHRFRLAWEHFFSPDSKLTVAPLVGLDTQSSAESGQGAGIFAQPQSDRQRSFSSGGRAEFAWKPFPFADVRLGTDILVERVHYDVDQLFDTRLRNIGAPNAEELVVSGIKVFGSYAEYIESQLRFGLLTLTPGVRLEQMHYGAGNFFLFEPRVWARVQLDIPTAIYGYAGIYHQAPAPEEVDPAIGNPGLIPLRADQYGLGVERKFGDIWTVKAEGFINVRSALVFPAEPKLLASGAIYNPLELNSGKGHSIGLEVLIRREFNARFYGWISYTLSRARESTAPGEPWLPTPYDQPHVLNVLIGCRVSPLIELSARLRIASGNPIAPVLSANLDADSGNYVPVTGPLGSARLPTFVSLDFESNSVWLADMFQISLYADIENIFARDNPELVLYDYKFRTSQYAISQPFQVLLGAKVAF